MSRHFVITIVAAVGLGGFASAQRPPVAGAPAGDPQRGKMLYDTGLRCYACHGFDGQTGSPRLVPLTRDETAFIAYVRKPATVAMPSFAGVPSQDLADVYAYVRSIPQAALPLDGIPLLKAIAARRATSR